MTNAARLPISRTWPALPPEPRRIPRAPSASTRSARPTRCAGRRSPTSRRASRRSARSCARSSPSPGVYRMLDARGDVLYVGKARSLKNRVANYCQVAALPGRLQRMVSQTRGDGDRHHQFRGRGAAARGAADQALPPAVQRAAARRQKLPVHPAARRARLPADHEASRRAQVQGRLLRPVRQRRIGQHHDQRAAEAVPAAELHRQLLRPPRPAVPAVPDQALLGAVRRADRRGRLCRAGRARRRTSSAASRARCRRRSRRRWRAAAEALDFETRGDAARPAARGDLHPGQPGDQRRGRGQRRRVRAGVEGRAGRRSRRSSSAAGRTGATARSSRATRRRSSEDEVLARRARAVLRGSAAAAHDPGRPRAARARAARAGAVRGGRAPGRDQRARSAATGGG